MTDIAVLSVALLLILFATALTTRLALGIYQLLFPPPVKKKAEPSKIKQYLTKPAKLIFGAYITVTWLVSTIATTYVIIYFFKHFYFNY